MLTSPFVLHIKINRVDWVVTGFLGYVPSLPPPSRTHTHTPVIMLNLPGNFNTCSHVDILAPRGDGHRIHAITLVVATHTL
jgi:hypothetical protein